MWRKRGDSKYRAVPTIVNGLKFASKKEATRYMTLLNLEKEKNVAELAIQPKFLVIPKFDKYRPMTYTADFLYKEAGVWVVEDCKGMKTEAYMVRIKVFLHTRWDHESKCYKFKEEYEDVQKAETFTFRET
jgi:hypothetical protein